MNQNQNQEMEQKQETKKICFETKDGKKYTWEKQGSEEKMNKYLYRIARRLGIKDHQDIEEFIKWALQAMDQQ